MLPFPKRLRINWRSVVYRVFIVLGSLAIAGWALVGASYFFIETYFSPNPYIDTQFADDFSWEAWKKIESGMSKQQVRQLIGNPLTEYSGPYGGYFGIKSGANCNSNSDGYSSDDALYWWDFAWIDARICYDDNDLVSGKAEIILYD